MIKNGIFKNLNWVNIIGGALILLLSAALLGAWNWIRNIDLTVSKIDVVVNRVQSQNAKIEENNKVYHKRISENMRAVNKIKERIAVVEERSKNNRQLLFYGR